MNTLVEKLACTLIESVGQFLPEMLTCFYMGFVCLYQNAGGLSMQWEQTRFRTSARNSGEILPDWQKKNEIDPPAGDKKWILGVPCSPDWRQEIKYICRQIARGWRQNNKLLRANSPIGDRKRY
jgi:hypothetical protein